MVDPGGTHSARRSFKFRPAPSAAERGLVRTVLGKGSYVL